MKNLILLLFLALVATPCVILSQSDSDSTGFAGDHFSLEGALDLFRQSTSPEDFENKLNQESSFVNNLDLNEDGNIDYVKVLDNYEENVHALVLQVDMGEDETQDIAVILIEKTGTETAILQIVGDEDVYGEEKIVEPFGDTFESGDNGKYNYVSEPGFVVVNVWGWPSVRFVYAPGYVVYRSPWRWHHYPNWWSPWKPHPWRWHYSKSRAFKVHYRPYNDYRVVKAHSFYKPRRSSSVTVRTKTVQTRTVIQTNKKGKSVSVNQEKRGKITTKSSKGKETKITKTRTEKSTRVKKGKKEGKQNKAGKVKTKKTKAIKSNKKVR